MGSTPPRRAFRRVRLSASAERMPAGHALWLEWSVAGSGAAVSSVQLASAGESGLEVIESIAEQGSRQVIFTRPGSYSFRLTVTFQDGVKRCKQVLVWVES